MASPAALAPEVEAPSAVEAAPAAPVVEWAADPRLTPPPAKAEPSSEAPAPADPAAGAPTGEGDAPKPADAAKPEIPVDWKAKLEAGDAEFLADFENHPKVKSFIAGRAGFLAQQQREADLRTAREAELDRAAEADPDSPLSQARLAERQTAIEAQRQQDLWGTAIGNVQAGIKVFMDGLSEGERETVNKATAKAYGELTPAAYAVYMADLTQSLVEARMPALKAAWEKETLPGLRKEVQAELMISDRTPDLGTGAVTAGGAADLTPEKYARMTPTEMHKLTSTPAGRARIDAMWAANP